jgi:hypothetical protein
MATLDDKAAGTKVISVVPVGGTRGVERVLAGWAMESTSTGIV